MNKTTNEQNTAISVENLTKTFGKLTAVNEITFQVKKGERFAFLGPNGAGKTTTIKMLTTLLSLTSGKISVNGYNPQIQQDEVRKSFGIVFQDPSVDEDLTAYENMTLHSALYHMPVKLRDERIKYLLEFVGLTERKNDFVRTFSGGMKRRLEIARALIHHPQILFLDEPTLGLDPQTRLHLWEYVQKLNQDEKMTVFFTTHYMEEAEKNADKIAIIDVGKIIAIGNPNEIKKQAGTLTLEEAFIKLTGKTIREENASAIDHLRTQKKAWGK